MPRVPIRPSYETRIEELEALVSAKDAIIEAARNNAVNDANDHDTAIAWHERRYENVIQTLNSAKSTIIELRDALKDADASGEIALEILGTHAQRDFLQAIELTKANREIERLKEIIRRNDERDDF